MTWTATMACKHAKVGQKEEEHIVSYLPLSHIAAQVSKINSFQYFYVNSLKTE
jgi:long-subunit acyl-CoA synthetase (AMP-forming)